MNELNLSNRLEQVASYVPQNSILADIGSDHAYLPTYLILQNKIQQAVAGEVNEGPYQSALSQVEKLGLSEKVSVRKGNGLAVISEKEVDAITICGMGGALITEILEAGKTKLTGVKRLILQPNVMGDRVRQWLLDNGYELIDESILEEDDKVYEVIVGEPGNPNAPYNEEQKQMQLLMGPYLIEEKNDAFVKKWTGELQNWRRILKQFEHANETKEVRKKKEDLERFIKQVEGVLS